jgi:hypothetical protein
VIFEIKQDDTSPPFRGVAKDARGQPVPLAGSSVVFRMSPQIQGLRADIVAEATFDEATSELSYAWQPGDTSVPGLYDAEFAVTFAAGAGVETFPSGEYAVVEVLPRATDGTAPTISPPPPEGAPPPEGSLLRAYGPNTSTPIPAETWTIVPLTGEWRQRVGPACFTPVTSGPHAGAMRCERTGVYALAGAVRFDPVNQAGTRGVWLTDPQTTDEWDFVDSAAAAKGVPTPVMVGGEAYLSVGEMVALLAWSSVATATTDSPLSEWASATLLG